MPFSAEALTALREATIWNPTGARALLAALEEHPDWVKYKADEFGPLHLMLDAVPPRRPAGPGLDLPYRPEPFPEAVLPACRHFGMATGEVLKGRTRTRAWAYPPGIRSAR